MPPKKGKGKKGKKKKGGAEKVKIETTLQMERERQRCMAPRLGDIYTRDENADEIKMDVAKYSIRRAAFREHTELSLASLSMPVVPDELIDHPELCSRLLVINLSRNKLFNSHNVFSVLKR